MNRTAVDLITVQPVPGPQAVDLVLEPMLLSLETLERRFTARERTQVLAHQGTDGG